MTPMKAATLARLRELMAEASPLPWENCDCNKLCKVWPSKDSDPHPEEPILEEASGANRRLIVAAINALPDLLAASEREAKWRERMPRCNYDGFGKPCGNTATRCGPAEWLYTCDSCNPDGFGEELPWADLVRGE